MLDVIGNRDDIELGDAGDIRLRDGAVPANDVEEDDVLAFAVRQVIVLIK